MSDYCGEPNGGLTDQHHQEEQGCRAAGERRTATRADLLEAINATCPHLPRPEVRQVFETVLDEVSEALRRGEAVKLRSFGQFIVRTKRERVGRNPRTGVEVPITPRRVLTFRPSSVLLDLVNAGRPAAERQTSTIAIEANEGASKPNGRDAGSGGRTVEA